MAQLNVRIDDKTKTEAEAVLEEIGMPMTTAVTVFLKTVVRERRIPFEVRADPFYSEENLHYLEKQMEAYKSGKMKLSEHNLIED